MKSAFVLDNGWCGCVKPLYGCSYGYAFTTVSDGRLIKSRCAIKEAQLAKVCLVTFITKWFAAAFI